MMSGYLPVQMYRVTVNGAEMSTTGTSITIPGSTFPSAGTYSFSVRAVNVLGESAPLMADFNGMIMFLLVHCCLLCCWLQLL